MKDNKDSQDQQHDLPDAEISGVDDSRRKFNKAGIIAPVLMSFSSKPVWAATCGVSGAMSGNLSGGCTQPLNGFTVEEFKNAVTWPLLSSSQIGSTKSVKFTFVFGKTPGTTEGGNRHLFGSSATLQGVLTGTDVLNLNNDRLKALFNCNDNPDQVLKDLITNYSRQSIASLLNSVLFQNYLYPGTASFYNPFTALSTAASCTNKKQAFIDATNALKNLTT